jgi:hypothetical protein
MSTGNIAIKGLAYDAIVKYATNVKSIIDVDYTKEDYNIFEQSLLTIAMSVTSSRDGGAVGYAGLLLSDGDYSDLVGASTATTYVPFPKPPETTTYPADAEKGALQMLMEQAQLAKSNYYTQEGCAEALRDLIMKNVPEDAIVELKHAKHGFNKVTAKSLMTHLEVNSRINDVFDKQELLAKYDEPIAFDGEVTLKAYFKSMGEQEKVLAKHGITVSHSMLMIRLLGQIKAHGDFKDEVADWEVKPEASQTYPEFKKFFIAADQERRQRDKYVNKTAASLANAATDTGGDVKTYIDGRLTLLATALRGSINAALEQRGTDTTAAAAATPPGTTAQADLTAEIAKLKSELGRLKANQAPAGGSNPARPPRVKCPHCNRYHPKVPAANCWALEGNKANAPAGWTAKATTQV